MKASFRVLLLVILTALLPRLATATPPGRVVAWGDNNYDQATVPAAALDGVVAVAARNYLSAALKDNGTVVTWGANFDPSIIAVPSGLNGVTAIAAGHQHILALKSNGTVVAWGYNGGGEVTGTPTSGSAVANPVTLNGQVLSGVVGVAGGSLHSLAIKSNGTVVAWGHNFFGQTNVPAGLTDVVAVAAGIYHSVALKSDGTVVAWGGPNANGELNVPAGLTDVIAISAGDYFSLALKSDGTVVAWGSNANGQTSVPVGLMDVTAVSTGYIHSLALKSDGSIVVWGDTTHGQAPIPSTVQSCVLGITGGGYHSLAIVTVQPTVIVPPADQTRLTGQTATFTATVTGTPPYTWQWYKDGTPLIDGVRISGATTTTLNVLNVSAADAGAYTVEVGNCPGDTMSDPGILTVSPAVQPGRVIAWGDNTFGQTTVPTTANSGVIAISAGQGHTLALKTSGAVLAWGWNTSGQTTVPAAANSGVIAISAGQGHSLALKYDGTVLAWGNNADGQTNIPVGLTGVTAISAGGAHSVALKNDGTVVVWGVGTGPSGYNLPPAGLTDVTAIAAGMYHTLALKSDGTVVAWGGNVFGESTVPGGLADVVAIAAGFYHSVAVKSDGTVVCWGSNSHGQSTVPGGVADMLNAAAGRYHTVTRKNDKTLTAWGDDSAGQSTIPVEAQGRVLALAAGWMHTVVIAGRTPIILDGPVTVFANLGADIIFHVDLDGTPPISVSWSRRTALGTSVIPDATDATLRLTGVTFASAALYTVTVSNEFGSATASATLTVLSSTTFDQWRAARFTPEELDNPAISGPLADPTKTGKPNLIKYAFNLEPVMSVGGPSVTLPSTWPLQPSLSGDGLKLVFHALRPDLIYTVEASMDLDEWSTSGVTIEANGTERTATFALPDTSERGFLHVRVTLPVE